MAGGEQWDKANLSTPHGFADDARSRTLLRAPVGTAVTWAERALGRRVIGVRALRGGSSSAVHALQIVTPEGSEAAILRTYVIAAVIEAEPHILEREARILELLERAPLPAPRLLGLDATGAAAGVPALLMTRLPGRLEWSPANMDRWLQRLAAVLPVLHDTPVSDSDGVQQFHPYRPDSWEPPAWLERPELWERALEVFHGPVVDPDRTFIHRDYHPGNVLWRRNLVSGIVDWQAASWGPRSVDVFHCRANLIERFGLEVADRFIDVWHEVSGSTYHPWAEVVMLVNTMGWRPRYRNERTARDLERALAQRLAELGE